MLLPNYFFVVLDFLCMGTDHRVPNVDVNDIWRSPPTCVKNKAEKLFSLKTRDKTLKMIPNVFFTLYLVARFILPTFGLGF